MNPRQLFSIILARWWVIVLTTLIVLGGALGFGLTRKPTYLASTQVLLDLGATNPVSGPALPAAMMQAYLSTQVEILTSQKVALRVVDALGLTDSPETVAAWQKETQGRGAIRQWVADGLLRRLDVRPTRDSSVLSITATAGTAASAASIANAFGQAYVETQIEIRIAPAKQSRVWFAEQVQLLRERLDQTQRRVTDYQRAKGIFSSEERFDVESARLLELSTQMVGLSAQTGEAAKRRQLAVESLSRGVASDLPEILQNPLVQQLKANQARLEARQRELSAVYGRN
ncbi:MAG: chain length determinant protein EpsF, partial [Betaproteobacteria bacterium]|nr:chain length determinant protein EpsF [Betaproteobacteria bacterium]